MCECLCLWLCASCVVVDFKIECLQINRNSLLHLAKTLICLFKLYCCASFVHFWARRRVASWSSCLGCLRVLYANCTTPQLGDFFSSCRCLWHGDNLWCKTVKSLVWLLNENVANASGFIVINTYIHIYKFSKSVCNRSTSKPIMMSANKSQNIYRECSEESSMRLWLKNQFLATKFQK